MIKNSVNTTMKFLIYLFIFLIVVLAFVFLFVIPEIKHYKSVKSKYSFNSQKHDKFLIEEKEYTSQLELIKNKNKKIIDRFAKKFDINEFKTFSEKYFDNVKLNKINSDVNSTAIKVYQFSAQVKAQNPKQFYSFVKELDTYSSLAKINFPINISSQNSVLNINFHMSVYSMSTK